jgi:EAL and modified HD-GYP domain-containing signal transduction protein
MVIACLARQPIVDPQRVVHGYELLFRGDADAKTCAASDGDQASAGVILRALMGLGLERIASGRPAFINCTGRLLTFEGLDLILSPGLAVLEVLENVEPTPAVVRKLQDLSAKGFKIALDDFVYDPKFDPFLEIADYVKIDVLATTPAEMREHRRRCPGRAALIAEKVETYDAFIRCVDLGFDYFQGWFFCTPETLEGHLPTADRLTTLRVIARLHEKDVAIAEIVKLVSLDPTLGYCVLRIANSSVYARPVEVRSVHEGVMRLGVSGLRRWVTIMMMAGLEHKPQELLVTGIIRARMCERLARDAGCDGDGMFTVGLFSILAAIFDRPLGLILGEIALTAAVADALLYGTGPAGEVLREVLAHERGAPPRPDALFPGARLAEAWIEALDWTEAMLRGLGIASRSTEPARAG